MSMTDLPRSAAWPETLARPSTAAARPPLSRDAQQMEQETEQVTSPFKTCGQDGAGSGSMAAPRAAARPVKHRLRWRLAKGVVLLVGIAGLGVLAGFLAFLTQIPTREPVMVKAADAIVVLTGGASRIADGVSLLAEGRGRRLLITGVNPIASPGEISRTLPAGDALLSCCVDLGHKALNTRGNAIEAAEWTRSRKFRSLVVVTSAWHMPRALVELSRSLPDVELVAYPVVTSRMEAEQWWRNPATVKLLFKEYLKYMMAKAKIRPAQAVMEAVVARPHPPAEVRVAE